MLIFHVLIIKMYWYINYSCNITPFIPFSDKELCYFNIEFTWELNRGNNIIKWLITSIILIIHVTDMTSFNTLEISKRVTLMVNSR